MAEPRNFMNKSYGRHIMQGLAPVKPERAPEEAREETSTLTCPQCGAQLTVEAESPEEERREAGTEGEAGEF